MDKSKKHWYELNVKNFKNIINKNIKNVDGSENGPITFFQDKLNIIVGKNNAGKTNILKAIIYSQNPLDDENHSYDWYVKDIHSEILDRDIKSNYLNTEVLLKMPLPESVSQNIKNDKLQLIISKYNNLRIEFGRSSTSNETDDDKNIFHVYYENEAIKNVELDEIDKFLKEEFKNEDFKIRPVVKVITTKKDEEEENDIVFDKYPLGPDWNKNDNLLNFLKAFSTNYEKIKKYIADYLSPSSGKNNNENDEKDSLRIDILNLINENLKKIFNDKFEGLNYYPEAFIQKGSLNIRIMSSIKYKVNYRHFSNQGTGIKNLFNLVLMLEKNKDNKHLNFIYVIDEIEDGLTISIQEKVVKYLYEFIKENKNVTIIYTTHSPSLLPEFSMIDQWANIIISYRREENLRDEKEVPENSNEISGELLTFVPNNIFETNETGIQLTGVNKNIKNNTELMKWCLDLNENTAKKLYESKNQNSNEDVK